jgi:hypothetical protein
MAEFRSVVECDTFCLKRNRLPTEAAYLFNSNRRKPRAGYAG